MNNKAQAHREGSKRATRSQPRIPNKTRAGDSLKPRDQVPGAAPAEIATLVIYYPNGRIWTKVDLGPVLYKLLERGARQLRCTIPQLIERSALCYVRSIKSAALKGGAR